MYLSYANTNVLTKAAAPKGLRRRSFYAFSKLPNLLFRQYGPGLKKNHQSQPSHYMAFAQSWLFVAPVIR